MDVYLDYNSTTPLLDEVKTSIKESLNIYGNPSSLHQFGASAKHKIEKARKEFASSINKTSDEYIFTSSATESNNAVLKGIFLNNLSKGNKTHIVTSKIEHPSVLYTCEYLEKLGAKITYIPVDSDGVIDLYELRRAVTFETSLISIIYANNEIGTIQPVEKIGEIAKELNVPFHSDAAQAFMKTDIDMDKSKIDFLTVAGHKIGAPKGIGALFYNNDYIYKLDPLLTGGNQENKLRSSTENNIYIIAFAEAVKSISKNKEERINNMKNLTKKLKSGIEKEISGIKFNGTKNESMRLPNTLNYSIEGVEGQSLVLQLDSNGIAVSTGSACSTANADASYVLRAIGRSEDEAFSSIRISTGWQTTEEEIDYMLKKLPEVISILRV
jgi:cysteine desulfurase